MMAVDGMEPIATQVLLVEENRALNLITKLAVPLALVRASGLCLATAPWPRCHDWHDNPPKSTKSSIFINTHNTRNR